MEGIEPTTEPTPMKRRNRSSDSLDTAQQSHEVPIKKRRGSNRLVIIDPTSNAKDVYIGSSAYETTQTLAATLRDLQGRYTEMYKELTHLKDVERARYQYDVSLTFNKYFDPMNPDHMSWFRQFARQTMRHKPVLQIIDEEAEPEPDHYVNNPFGIPIGLEERRNRPRTFYVLCAKITMDNLNIPLALEFYTHKCPK